MNTSTFPDDKVSICIGKEWYRFPSHFFLPSQNWRVKFVKSEFRGQLPQMYAEGENATVIERPNFNDLNQEESDRYVKVSKKFVKSHSDSNTGTYVSIYLTNFFRLIFRMFRMNVTF